MLEASYDVEIAADGEAAIRLLRQPDAHYDLLISDLNMPDMDGLTLIREAQRINPTLAGDRDHRLFDGVERDRGTQSRRDRIPDETLRHDPGARGGGQSPERTTRVIQLSDVTKSFGDRVLFGHVTWQIGDGERVGLCGPNGAGKTTLLKILGGIEEADSGGDRQAGRPHDRLPAAGRPEHSGTNGLRGSQQCVSAAARYEGGDA